MKCNRIVIYLIIPLALISTLSLFDNVHAQTNSTTTNNQTMSQQSQQNQNANLTAQALMKTDIAEIKDILMNAKLAVVDGNFKQALEDVINVEKQLLLLEPSPPTKFLNNVHKAIGAISQSDIEKSLNTLTNIQVTLLKAENLILKNVAANPELMQQFEPVKQFDTLKTNTIKNTATNSQMQQFDTEKQFDIKKEFDNLGLNPNLVDFKGIEDR